MLLNQTIDAVVTWVDGNDPAHQSKLHKYLKTVGISSSQLDPARLHSSNEITYCIQSLLKNASWLRTIYIVTDAQRPDILDELIGTEYADRVKLIDHQVIFRDFEDCLPTFNSIAIETVIWRIPGLSEKFIYCNDDLFILRNVKESDFFIDNKVVVRGRWRWQFKSTNAHRELQKRSATLAGFKYRFLHLPHAPFALHKSTFQDFFAKYPELLKQNISYPLRSDKQFWPISLMQHLEFKHKNAILDNSKQAIMINGACHSEHKQNSRLKKINSTIVFLCIQGMESMSYERQQQLWLWLTQFIN